MNEIIVYADGWLKYLSEVYRCSLGAGGLIDKTDKREGDNKTPIGEYPLRRVFWRENKLSSAPKTNLELNKITQNMGWCDDVNSDDYNRLITLPTDFSHEKLHRNDDVYDIIIELGHNDNPIVKNLGSAVFMHIARENYKPTEGCVALAKHDLLDLLEKISDNTMIKILDENYPLTEK